MRLGHSSNPALGNKVFNNVGTLDASETMTIRGTINKTILLSLLVFTSAILTWKLAMVQNILAGTLATVGVFGGLGMALVTIFKKDWAHITAPIYALLEGLFLGAISALINSYFPGIAFQAIGLTFGVLAVMLVLYKTRIIKVTSKFKKGIIAATGGIMLFYVVSLVMSLFGGNGINLMSMGWLGIGIQAVIVIVAALNLVLDFDFIENSATAGYPKQMEWYSAFGLMVTLVWLYLEILRLLTLLARSN